MNWRSKAGIQRWLAVLPGGISSYRWGQRQWGSLRRFDVKSRLDHAIGLLECMAQKNIRMTDKTMVEFGTGWAPVLPLVYWLAGYEQCYTYDIERLANPQLIIASARQLYDVAANLHPTSTRLQSWKDEWIQSERLRQLQQAQEPGFTANKILQLTNLSYRAPGDATHTGLDAASIDMVFSNLVLGHVPEKVVIGMIGEAYRVLKPGGYTLHNIDLSDQFAQSDGTITKINFLQYSPMEWERFNSVFCYHNRCRSVRYRQWFTAAGFEILSWHDRVDQRSLEALPTFRLHPDFSMFSPQEICTTSIQLLARRP